MLRFIWFIATLNQMFTKNVRKKCENWSSFQLANSGFFLLKYLMEVSSSHLWAGVLLSPIVISCFTRHILSFPAQGPFVHDTFQAPAPKES